MGKDEISVQGVTKGQIRVQNDDVVRSIARRMIPGGLYRTLSDALNSYKVIVKEGYGLWRQISNLSNLSSDKKKQIEKLTLKSLKHPFYVRPGTLDAHNLVSCVIREEYGLLPKNFPDPRWMIDAGVYTGDTTVYFLNRFPKLNVIGLEANRDNFKIASMNLKPYGERVEILFRALWKSSCKLKLKGDLNGSHVEEISSDLDVDYDVYGLSIADIVQKYNISEIDILKMDIEGAEATVFESGYEEWLPKVNLLIIEIHGDRCFNVVEKALLKFNFKMTRYRSVYYCSR